MAFLFLLTKISIPKFDKQITSLIVCLVYILEREEPEKGQFVKKVSLSKYRGSLIIHQVPDKRIEIPSLP